MNGHSKSLCQPPCVERVTVVTSYVSLALSLSANTVYRKSRANQHKSIVPAHLLLQCKEHSANLCMHVTILLAEPLLLPRGGLLCYVRCIPLTSSVKGMVYVIASSHITNTNCYVRVVYALFFFLTFHDLPSTLSIST